GTDATVPFISRYRKEATGSLDEVAITAIRDRLIQLEELDKRREAILKSLEERDLLTDELKEQIEAAETMATLEDIYLPYKPKRRTRATIAREKGLEPLAQAVFEQTGIDPYKEAEQYINTSEDIEEAKRVETIDDALAGARDIIAEWINEDQNARAKMRELFFTKGEISSKLLSSDEAAAAKYKDYFEWSEPVKSAPSHRVLAMFRGERELHLSVKVTPPEAEALKLLEKQFVKGSGADSEQVREAKEDGYKRLLAPSMENEIRSEMKSKADETAIRVFADNLRELLLASPLGEKRVLAIDPGYRTGCKLVCLDNQGSLLENTTIYLSASDEKVKEAETIAKTKNCSVSYMLIETNNTN
ncbi:MAG: RNA-binding transcriptional accessory protein, partial [Rhodospirillales bacterium]|nr:RNA-binding transcriptional accessory protein [Rhodospirillales bacterium]